VGAALEAVERAPLGTARLLDEPHLRLFRRAPPLAAVALDARADDVLPRGASALRTRHDVVEVQLALLEDDAAVLTGVAVAEVDVVPGEAHAPLRQTVVFREQDDPRHANGAADQTDRVVVLVRGELRP